jgi:hypothetical protein
MGLLRSLWQKKGEMTPEDEVVRRKNEGALPLLNYLLEQVAFDNDADKKPRLQDGLLALLGAVVAVVVEGRLKRTPLFGTEDAAKDWLGAFGAWCLGFVRQEREGGRLTSPDEPGGACDPVRRAALAWHTSCEILGLTPPTVFCPRSERWLPASGLRPADCSWDSALAAALGVLDKVERAAAGRGYEVFFPTFLPGVQEPGPIFVARMTALVPGQIDGGPPSVLLAPWSAWSLTEAGRTRISGLLGAAPVRDTLKLASSAVAFLLELEPAELCAGDSRLKLPTLPVPARPVRRIEVEEQSHNLAHLIAAWAASRQRSLRRVCATCRVMADDLRLHTVDGLEHKLESLCALAEARRQDFLFLVHHNQVSFPADLTKLAGPRVLINGRRGHGDVTLETLGDLFRHPDLLTDSFDEYRRALACVKGAEGYLDARYEPDDRKELDTLVTAAPLDRKAGIGPEPPLFACLFGTSPWDPAVYLLTALAKGIEERDERQVGTAAELRVPLPLLLSRLGKGGEPADEVLAAIRAGLDELKERLRTDLPINDLTLRNAVCFDVDKLLLLIVGEQSGGMASYRTGPLRTLREYARQAGLLFIASDHHHELFLRREWPARGKPAEAESSAPQRD